MTFLTLYTELSDRVRSYDPAIAGDLTKLKRWINMAQQYICGKRAWPFMLAEETIHTVIDKTTGTVSVSPISSILSGGQIVFIGTGKDVVGSDTLFDSNDVGSFIKFSGTNDWYKISAVSDATHLTLETTYVATTSLVGGTYVIRKLLYTTVTPLIQILDMKQLSTPTQVISLSPRETDFFFPLYYDAGTPYCYIMSSPSSTGTLQFSFVFSPSSYMNIMVRGIKVLSDMSADSDTSIIPSLWHDAIINIASFYAFQSMNDTRASTELTIGEGRISDMAKIYSHDLGRHRVMRSINNGRYDYESDWVIPSNFGNVL